MDWILVAQDTVVDAGDELNALEVLLDAVITPLAHILLCSFFLVIGIYLLLPPRGRGKQFLVGSLLTAVSIGLFLMPTLGQLPTAPALFLLEGLAILGGLGTVTSRSPVYSAIWFASALLAIGAILLMGGSQFLGLATVAVYAGAIVVTFLFVLMLAQPEGHAVYDRISWGWFPSFCASVAGVSVAAIIAAGLLHDRTNEAVGINRALYADIVAAIDSDALKDIRLTRDANGVPLLNVTLAPDSDLLKEGDAELAAAIRKAVGGAIAPATRINIREEDILASDHVARLGGELYGRHLISVQVAAVLLLAALVGAIAMAIHGKDVSPSIRTGKVAMR